MATNKPKQKKRRRSKYPGVVYLIHFDLPYYGKLHYLGWSHTPHTLTGRLHHHRNGTGARFMAVVSQAGITWSVVRTWKGDRMFERVLKERKEARRLCPVCAEREGRAVAPASYTPEQIKAAYARFQARLVRRLLVTLEARQRAILETILEKEGLSIAVSSLPALRSNPAKQSAPTDGGGD